MSIADKLVLIAENEQKVYKAGRDSFWDGFQDYGNRTYYQNAFDGRNFNKINFYPAYDIKPVGDADRLFYAWESGSEGEKHDMNLRQRLKECGVVLDTSKATNLSSAFNYFRAKEIPPIDFTGLTKTSDYVFAYGWGGVKTIEKIIVNENTAYDNWFYNTNGLENITVEGVIGQSGLDFSPCNILTAESIESIINALSDHTSGLVVTFSLESVNKAFETGEGLLNGNTSAEWTSLVNSKKNWTISLV